MIKLLHLFPGQGIQKVGMHQSLDTQKYLQLVKIIPNLQEYIENGPQELLNQTQYAQPAIFISSYLKYALKTTTQSQYAIGHSVGEYTALTIAGHLQPEDTVRLLYQRGCIMKECSNNRKLGMLAVAGNANYDELINKSLKKNEIIELAAFNNVKQTVYSGDENSLKQFQIELKKQKVISKFLEVSTAFHCSILSGGKPKLEMELRKYVNFDQNSVIKVIGNVDAKVYENYEQIINGLTQQLDHPVKFYQSVESIRPFESIEYGSRVLTNLI